MSQRWRKYSPEFRAGALERLKNCVSVSGLARELGIRRKWLYQWRDEARGAASIAAGKAEAVAPVSEPEVEALRQRIAELERLAGRQTAEIDFFRGALRRVEDRRQRSGKTGGEASGRKSGA